ncbi:hypothetical protein SCHPADRAFT_906214 [Schizopora paradoxa]|uniref:Uncharacterized protein n=1 Tax=Schizopora paradoxa TaxID=27342 RepID=A0A0H2RH30_9AGAM|nr:hypothetical protein SCHPADRAFT_906214 [Schizopora paradoxa]
MNSNPTNSRFDLLLFADGSNSILRQEHRASSANDGLVFAHQHPDVHVENSTDIQHSRSEPYASAIR